VIAGIAGIAENAGDGKRPEFYVIGPGNDPMTRSPDSGIPAILLDYYRQE
jgi:hypothetical protein